MPKNWSWSWFCDSFIAINKFPKRKARESPNFINSSTKILMIGFAFRTISNFTTIKSSHKAFSVVLFIFLLLVGKKKGGKYQEDVLIIKQFNDLLPLWSYYFTGRDHTRNVPGGNFSISFWWPIFLHLSQRAPHKLTQFVKTHTQKKKFDALLLKICHEYHNLVGCPPIRFRI